LVRERGAKKAENLKNVFRQLFPVVRVYVVMVEARDQKPHPNEICIKRTKFLTLSLLPKVTSKRKQVLYYYSSAETPRLTTGSKLLFAATTFGKILDFL